VGVFFAGEGHAVAIAGEWAMGITRSACFGTQVGVIFANHSRATATKPFAACSRRVAWGHHQGKHAAGRPGDLAVLGLLESALEDDKPYERPLVHRTPVPQTQPFVASRRKICAASSSARFRWLTKISEQNDTS